MDTVEFQDWEVLHSNSDDSDSVLPPPHNSFDVIDSSDGLIQVDYFSLDRPNRVEELDDASAESDNPSWIDPGLEGEDPNRFLHKESAEFWSDSSSERSSNSKNEVMMGGFSENEGKQLGGGGGGFEKNDGEMSLGSKFSSEIELGSDKVDDFVVEDSPVVVGAEEDRVNLGEGTGDVMAKDENDTKSGSEIIDESSENNKNKNGGGGGVGEIEKRRRGIVWWKMPMEFLKYCMIKMSPMWTVSVAAAVVGFVILGRRLYKMKKKARGLQINVAVDDKKVSQVMSRAARLNEAFSIVKRVPIVRPALPAVGTNPWPAMSLR